MDKWGELGVLIKRLCSLVGHGEVWWGLVGLAGPSGGNRITGLWWG